MRQRSFRRSGGLTRSVRSSTAAVAAVLLVGCSPGRTVDLSPARWPAGELETYLARTAELGRPKGLGEADSAMVTGTTGAVAVRAGREALRQGGSAVDAVITTALAQIALAAGSWVSYAGLFNLIYFDARSRTVHSLNAGFNTVRDETEPATIPSCLGPSGIQAYTPSGRTALVPGFFAGVQAAHDRFGRLPFDRLFAPAIYLAEEGFEVSGILGGGLAMRKDVLSRLPATRAVFMKNDSTPYQNGDLFRQPALAATLRRVAAEGASFIYRGEWARQFVEAVRAEGGRMTLKDLAAYRAVWSEPVRASYRGYELHGAAWPTFGATATLEAMQVLEHVDLPNLPRYWESAETLYPFIEASHVQFLAGPPGGGVGVPAGWAQQRFPAHDLSNAGRLRKETAAFWWNEIRQPTTWRELERGAAEAQRQAREALVALAASGGGHSDAVVAVDPQGNVAAATHTINTVLWGATGLNVGGISIPDAACFQQDLIRRAGPGVRLPDPTNPIIVTKDGDWVLAGSSIGAGLLENTLAVLVNVLDYGQDPYVALHAPQFSGSGLEQQALPDGDFSAALVAALNARGGHAVLRPKAQLQPSFGSWISIQRDPTTGRLRGATRDMYNGAVDGLGLGAGLRGREGTGENYAAMLRWKNPFHRNR